MPTSFLGLTTNTQASGSATTFLTWRLSINDESNSNMSKIDTFAQNTSASITTLQTAVSYAVNATESTINNYVATVPGFTSYTDKRLINLMLDVTQTGTTTLNINSLGTKTLYKISSNGTAGNLDSGDLVAGRPNFFMYDLAGGYWLWVNGTSADQINIAGNVNNIPIITGNGIGDSGISASSLSTNDGYFIVSQLSSNLRNESVLVAGSGIGLVVNTAASTIKVTNNIVAGVNMSLGVDSSSSAVTINSQTAASSIAPSTASYIVLGADSVLTNERVLTAGSNVSISSSASEVIIHNTGAAADGWTPANATWTYYSTTSLGITNASSILSVGDKLKYAASGSTIYQYVTAISGSITTVNGGSAYPVPNASITDNYYSHQTSPLGFPQWFALSAPTWDTTGIDNGSGGQPWTQMAIFNMHGRTFNYRVSASGIKVSTTNYIRFTLPKSPNNSYGEIGSCFIADAGGLNYPGVVRYDGAWLWDSNISDNTSLTTVWCNLSYDV